jgi:hypothetical protein
MARRLYWDCAETSICFLYASAQSLLAQLHGMRQQSQLTLSLYVLFVPSAEEEWSGRSHIAISTRILLSTIMIPTAKSLLFSLFMSNLESVPAGPGVTTINVI